jgi:hypothetical protein
MTTHTSSGGPLGRLSLSSLISQRARSIDASGIRKVFDLAAKMKDPINLSIGQPEITREANANIQYRCKADDKVFGNTLEYYNMKKDITSKTNPYMVGYEDRAQAVSYKNKVAASQPINVPPDYIVAIPDSKSQNYKDLAKYAKFTGGYNESNADLYSATSKTLKVASTDYLAGSLGSPSTVDYGKYKNDNPLICNVVYPQVLGLLDSNTKEKNEVSCEYAKQCGVSWSSLKCT